MPNLELDDILNAIENFNVRTGKVVTIEGQKREDYWLRFEGERSRVPVGTKEELEQAMAERWRLGLTVRGALDIIEKYEAQGGVITTLEGLEGERLKIRFEGGRGLLTIKDDKALKYLLVDQFLPRT